MSIICASHTRAECLPNWRACCPSTLARSSISVRARAISLGGRPRLQSASMQWIARCLCCERVREAPGGDHPSLRWICGRMEEIPLQGPYGLVTAGDSIHWMDWDVVFRQLHDSLAPSGFLALVRRYERPVPWQDELAELISRHSVYRRWQAYDLIDEITERGPMRTATLAASRPSITSIVGALSDRELLGQTRTLVLHERHLQGAIIDHLTEIDASGLDPVEEAATCIRGSAEGSRATRPELGGRNGLASMTSWNRTKPCVS